MSGDRPPADSGAWDALIVGGGAAGIAAAADLARRGRRVLLLEARQRLGGRVDTRAGPPGAPLELGAEWVHGRPAVTLAWADRLGVPLVRSDETARLLGPGGGRPFDHRALVPAALQRLREAAPELGGDGGGDGGDDDSDDDSSDGRENGDVDVATVVARLDPPLGRPAATALAALVEGIDAADPDRLSLRALLRSSGGAGGGPEPQYRPLGGYGALLGALADLARRRGAEIRLGAPVRALRWRPGWVEADLDGGKGAPVRARCVVVTVPTGPLAAGRPAFEPDLPGKRAEARALPLGAVVKVALSFRRVLWEPGDAPAPAFVHDPDGSFGTVWTRAPLRAPLLTAWAGGPRGRALSELRGRAGDDAVVARALAAVARGFGVRGRRLERELIGARVADWASDRWSGGAYAYTRVGAPLDARRRLAIPVARTLFFAGEATDADGQAGTVAGALASGERAAGEVAAALRRAVPGRVGRGRERSDVPTGTLGARRGEPDPEHSVGGDSE